MVGEKDLKTLVSIANRFSGVEILQIRTGYAKRKIMIYKVNLHPYGLITRIDIYPEGTELESQEKNKQES
jgi:hypothetical protein